MAEDEESSQASVKSQSSVVLDQMLSDVSTLQHSLLSQIQASKFKSKQNDLAMFPETESPEVKVKQLEVQESIPLQVKLRERLYDKPENSGVMQYVRMQTERKRSISGSDSLPERPIPLKRSSILAPLPTHVPKMGLASLPDQDKAFTGLSKQEVSILQNIVNRKRPNQLTPLSSSTDLNSSLPGVTAFDNLRPVNFEIDDNHKTQKADVVGKLVFNPSIPDFNSVTKKRTDTSMIRHRDTVANSYSTNIELINEPGLNLCVQDGVEDDNVNEQKTEIISCPNSEKQIPLVESMREKQETISLRPMERSKSTVKYQLEASVLSPPENSTRISLFKRNKYDDTVPENTKVFEKLIELRQKLGWVIDIPRHGPNTRKMMDKLKDFTKEDKESGKAETDSGEFYYCLPQNRNNLKARYNPYDLQVVSVNEARAEEMYFTISASNVTVYYETDGKISESSTTPSLWWLWERRLFYMIFHFPVFVKFRLWKAFQYWKKAINRKKRISHQDKLYHSLFIANEVLQGCLMHVRSLCESAKSALKDGDTSCLISFVELDTGKTMILQEFEGLQKNRCDQALHQLNSLRKKIIEIVWESCATVAEMEGITQGIRDEYNGKVIKSVRTAHTPSQQKYSNSQRKFGNVSSLKKGDERKKNKPLYAEIAEWRKILARLSCFLRCVDYILQDLLSHLVFSAAQKLLNHMLTSYDAQDLEGKNDDRDEKIPSGKTMMSFIPSSRRHSFNFSSDAKKKKKVSPETYVIPHYDFDKVEEVKHPPDIDEILEEIKQREIVEEVINPVFTIRLVLNVLPITSSQSQTRSRSKQCKSRVKRSLPSDETTGRSMEEESGTETESEYESGESEFEDATLHDSTDDQDHYAYPEQLKQKSQQKHKSVISLSPSPAEFYSSMKSLICYFEDTVVQVTPMLQEPKLAVFYSPPKRDLHLKFDEEEVEERREMLPNWPDLDLILREDPAYQSLLNGILDCINRQMRLLEQFTSNYDPFCQMVDQSRKLHVEESIAKKPWMTDEFSQALATHTEMIQQMNNMITCQRVAMVQVQALDFQKSCLPYPQAVVDAVNRILPVIANKHNDDLITIIKGASKRLDKTITTVEEFVDHLSFLGRMSTELPALEKEFIVVNRLFTIAQDYNIMINAEDMALYQTLSPSFQHLKSTVLYCEAKKDDNIKKFSSQLDTLISSIHQTLINLKSRVQTPELLNADTHSLSALETIRLLQEEVQALSVKARSYASYQDRFGSSLSKHKKSYIGEFQTSERTENSVQDIQTDLNEIERDLSLRGLLWQSLEEWAKLVAEWTTTSFDSISVEGLQKSVNKFTQTVYMLEKGLPHNEMVPKLKEKVVDFKQGMPVITSLRNPSLQPRHWFEIQRLINRTFSHDKNFTLGNLLEMNIFKHKEKIQEIATKASNEATLEHMLQKVIDLWLNTDFRLVPHSARDTYVIYGADDIMAQLEESQVTIGTIRGSRYVIPIKALVEEWERKLQAFSRTLDEWLMCQRNWLYLEQIFNTPDIQRQLPAEYKMFMSVDKAWKDIMRRTKDRPNALKSAITPGTLDTLQMCNVNLEKIQRCLEDYLETKRFIFPRFYFLSNDELLDILAQSKDPNAIQPHLGKCFDNIKHLDIRILPRQPPTVKSIISAEGEVIDMPRNIRARGAVEQWLCTVEAGMFETVKKHLKLGLADWQATNLKGWVLKHPGQVALTGIQIMFNKEVTKALDSQDPTASLKQSQAQVVDLLNQLASFSSSSLQSFQRTSIEALLTITVHNRDIIVSMITNKVRKREDFEWKRQLHYEWDETTNNCQVVQSNAFFIYGYEYLGCSTRLVITALTDRCYLTLTGALHLHLGGSPAGPAGTGKTETVKDLAKAMGKQCVVFNCSEGLDYKMLGKFFSGLAQSGSWCCFDEFNRIDVEVLSVVAMQVHTIKAAKDAQSLRFMFDGREVKLNPTCGYFVTMNPTYAGRVELPDNLKYLFRPVAMMVPDYALIAEIMLFSEGFTAAKSLSKKIVNLYQLASKQLSQQDHYDFGMRAIKSVLVMAGNGRSNMLQKNPVGTRTLTEDDESYILIHSLRDANMPKFLAEDVPLFDSILNDLFPGISPPDQDHGALEKAISMSIRDLRLQYWPHQIEKVKQLYNQIMVRHGIMLVGPTGGGKTLVRTILQKALVLLPMMQAQLDEEQDQKDVNSKRPSLFNASRGKKGHVEAFIVNPKCVKLGELYGETDPNTFEWSDGLIANAARKFSKDLSSPVPILNAEEELNLATVGQVQSMSTLTDVAFHAGLGTKKSHVNSNLEAVSPSAMEFQKSNCMEEEVAGKDSSSITEWRWMILDGPVDTLWVENLNTALDDSKILCLASGERISLAPGMRLIFEVDNLSNASPATISRCAMVYMDPGDLGWRPYVKTWLNHLPRGMPESGKNFLHALFEASIDKGLNFLHKYKDHQAIQAPDLSIIGTLCHILSAYIDFLSSHGGFGAPDEKEKGASLSASNPVDRTSSCSPSRAETEVPGSRMKRRNPKTQSKTEDRGTFDKMGDSSSKGSDKKMFFLERHPAQLTNLLGKLYVFAFTWSIGGLLKRREFMEEDDSNSIRRTGNPQVVERADVNSEFDNFARELFDVEPPLGVRLPAGNQSIYGYFIDVEGGTFVPWHVLIPSTKSLIEKGAVITIGETLGIMSDKKKLEMKEGEIIPTVDIVRFSFLTSLLLVNKHPVLLTGESGVGKTAIIKHMLKELEKEGGTSTEKASTVLGAVFQFSERRSSLLENISSLTTFHSHDKDRDIDLLLGSKGKQVSVISTMIQCSAQTTSKRLQAQITQKLIKKSRACLGAPKGRKVMVFVDDLNMPAMEEYGAQPPLELLRQFLDMGGFYDTKKLVWKDILDVTIVAACSPPGGGRNPTTPRLLKHFSIFTLPQPSTKSLQHIYQVQLGRFLREGEFMPEVVKCLFPLVSASIAVYHHMCAVMLPTPTKSHYTFNIRDLSKVIQGLLQAHESVILRKENCAQLFAHEATRVFHDRLINTADRETFFQILSDNLQNYFKVRWSVQNLMKESVLFGDFFDIGEHSSHLYRPLTDHNKLAPVLEEYHMRQNMGETAEQLVFFKEAVEHVIRAVRVFRQLGGHLLLVGLDGTGKSTIVHLASYIANCELYRLKLHNQYGMTEFRDDLKMLFMHAGVKGIPTVILLNDSDIVKESFLEDINCILNSGEVPDLFDNEELDGIAMELKAVANEVGIPDTRASIYAFFIQRIRQKLHVVLTMSPAGDKLRQRCRMNPALINCCTIDWFNEWTDEAMLSVARVFFANTEFIADETRHDVQKLKEQAAQICVDIHKSISAMATRFWVEARRHYYSTPSSYMEVIRLYSCMLRENKEEFIHNRNRLQNGLSALTNASTLVGVMQEELVSLGPVIEKKANDTEVLLKQLEEDQLAAKEVEDIVAQEEAIMARETQIVQDYADECEYDLASVLPVLQDAIASLETLDKTSISELRVYTKPPQLVATVMAAVCVLFQKKTDWATGKLFLGDPQFLKLLLNYDRNNQPEKVYAKLKKYTEDPNFNPDAVGKVSLACKCICSWVLAIDNYNTVYKMVTPKQKRVQEAREALKLAQDSLAKKQTNLKTIQDHLQNIQCQYQDSVEQREALKERHRVTGLRIERASILISALGDEEVRWAQAVKILDMKLGGLVGDTLVAAASVAYLGAFTAPYRNAAVEDWVKMCKDAGVPISKDFDLVRSMIDAGQVMKWHNNGLPRDKFSTESATVVSKARKWPLFIDPQGQAVRWIKEMERLSHLRIVSAGDQNIMRTIETAIKVGDPCLLMDVREELDPALRPVLLQERFHKGGQLLMKLGEVELEYNTNFRLYLATTLANPHFLPGIYLQVNVINFTVTFDGLQEQLLSVVVKQERPILEKQRTELLESIANDRQLLRDLEDKSLSLLQRTEGHLLDDQDLVVALQQSKAKSQEIYKRVEESEETEKKLSLACKRYLPVKICK